MLPDIGALLAGHALYAKQNGLSPERDEGRLTQALHEAAALAGDREQDEPAALFFALARWPRAFGKAHGRMTLHLTVEHARAIGLAFALDASVLELMRARVVREGITFEDLRAWFAERLAPIPRRPWPPR